MLAFSAAGDAALQPELCRHNVDLWLSCAVSFYVVLCTVLVTGIYAYFLFMSKAICVSDC